MRTLDTVVLVKLMRLCEDPRCGGIRVFEPGQKIFSTGEPGDYMAILLTGAVDIMIHDKTVNQLEVGALFGEMGLIDQVPRSADAVATEQCRVAVIREEQFISVLEQTPELALSIMRILTDRLRSATAS